MKPLLALVTALALASAVAAVTAMGDGSPYTPGLVQGADGVVSPDHGIRFVTLATPKSTVVAAIRVRTGRVARSNVLRGFYGVPIVAWDNSTGGVSADGRTLVLGSYGPLPGDAGVTRFAVLRTKTLRKARTLALPGSWAYDAISPDGSRMFLIEYLAAGQNPHYRVRSLDVRTGRLDPEAVVDRREDEVFMRGQPVTRVASTDGRWAYTLSCVSSSRWRCGYECAVAGRSRSEPAARASHSSTRRRWSSGARPAREVPRSRPQLRARPR